MNDKKIMKEVADNLVKGSVKQNQKLDQEIVLKETGEKSLTPAGLNEIAGLGMRRVDPLDIRPPQILLVQKTSDFELMETKDGKKPKVGQFFHTAKKEIYDTFECYFLWAAKLDVKNKFVEGNPLISIYRAIGAMEDMSTFAMTFRSSALFALSSLFSAVLGQHAPMFCFKCTLENKLIEGTKGSWYVPVVRVGEIVTEPKIFNELYAMAKKLDSQTQEVMEAQQKETEEDE